MIKNELMIVGFSGLLFFLFSFDIYVYGWIQCVRACNEQVLDFYHSTLPQSYRPLESLLKPWLVLFTRVFRSGPFFFLDEFSYKIYFADVLIPAFVFCSCVIGLGLVALAATQCGKRKYVLCEWFWHHCYGSSCEFLFLVKIIYVVFVM